MSSSFPVLTLDTTSWVARTYAAFYVYLHIFHRMYSNIQFGLVAWPHLMLFVKYTSDALIFMKRFNLKLISPISFTRTEFTVWYPCSF